MKKPDFFKDTELKREITLEAIKWSITFSRLNYIDPTTGEEHTAELKPLDDDTVIEEDFWKFLVEFCESIAKWNEIDREIFISCCGEMYTYPGDTPYLEWRMGNQYRKPWNDEMFVNDDRTKHLTSPHQLLRRKRIKLSNWKAWLMTLIMVKKKKRVLKNLKTFFS